MKKINLISITILTQLILIFTTIVSFANYDPIKLQPLLGTDYYSITNNPIIEGPINSEIEFDQFLSEDGTKRINSKVSYSVKSTGTYTPGQLSWKTSRMFIAVTFFDPVTKQISSMGYQFKPTELITANNTVTTVTIDKEQVVSGIIKGMNAETDLKYIKAEDLEALKEAIRYGFENGCGLRVNAEISKFIVPAGIETNRELLADESNIVGKPILVRDFNNSVEEDRDKLFKWAKSSPYPFTNATGFVNDAITRAKGSVGDANVCSFKAELALADTLFQADKTSFTDTSGTTRDRMEIYDISDNLVFGDTVNPGEQYKACSYLQNQGTSEIEKHELFLDAYMQTADINNLNTPNHLKTYLETAFIDGTVSLGDKLQISETAKYCTIFTAPSRDFRIEHQIPNYYIPDKDTKTTNNLAARILKVAEQDLAVTNISIEDSFKTNGTNTYTVDIAKLLGNKEIKDVNTRITVKNADKKTIYDNTLIANKTLNLNDSYTYTISANNVNSNRNTVCATIDIKHHNAGDDEKLENSTLCQDFTGELDIFLSNFKINPGTIYQKDSKKTEKRTLDFSVDVNALGKTGIYNTNIVFKDAAGKIIYKEDNIVVSTHAKQVVTFSKELPLSVGANVFRAEVNLNPKKVAEFSKAANPYSNNVIESSTTLLFNKAANICSTNQSRSDFTITYTRTTVVANLETRYDSEGRRYTVCVQESETVETIPVNHFETFKINGIMFRSKITKDAFIKEHDIKANVVKENEAWINMFTHNNAERDLLKIRAGMGYELKVETEYNHNFTDAPKPLTDVGDCGYSTVVPDAPTPSVPSERIRVSHEGDDRYITKATEIKKNENGEIRTYELRGANAAGTGAGDKFFVSENVKTGQKLTADVTLEDFNAYTGEVLCNRKSGYFTIDGHYSQDFITQIVQ